MKTSFLVLSLSMALSACVSLEFPGVVSDAAKAAQSLTAKKDQEAKETKEMFAAAKGDKKPIVSHTYIGKEEQTVAEIKQGCVIEATQKFAQIIGTDVRSVVLENEVVSLKGKVVANCKLALQQ